MNESLKMDKKELRKQKRAYDIFFRKLEAWMSKPHADDEIRRLIDRTDLQIYRTIHYAPTAWKEGVAILQAELDARKQKRDGLNVKRIGDHTEFALSKADAKRKRTARRNGKNSTGAPLSDTREQITSAVRDVRKSIKDGHQMKRACELAVKQHALTIKWEALQKHVKKVTN